MRLIFLLLSKRVIFSQFYCRIYSKKSFMRLFPDLNFFSAQIDNEEEAVISKLSRLVRFSFFCLYFCCDENDNDWNTQKVETFQQKRNSVTRWPYYLFQNLGTLLVFDCFIQLFYFYTSAYFASYQHEHSILFATGKAHAPNITKPITEFIFDMLFLLKAVWANSIKKLL